MLKGQAKTDYQRDYMRKRRGSNSVGLTGSNKQPNAEADTIAEKMLADLNNRGYPTNHLTMVIQDASIDNPSNIEYIDAGGYPVYDN